MEIRDAKSSEIVYYRDTNGDYTAEKNELVSGALACGCGAFPDLSIHRFT
jgi:hypothetical protein